MKTIIALISRIREKANRLIIKELGNNDIKDLAPSHGSIISVLFIHEELSMKELAEKIDRDKSTVTALVNKLIKLGYISKRNDLVDSRVSLISLTPKGKALKPVFTDISEKLLDQVYKSLDDHEKEVINTILTKINSNW